MSTINRSFTNTNTNTDRTPEKNLWCRDTAWKVIQNRLGFNPFRETNGCRLRICTRDPTECRGAHTIEELKPFKYIQDFKQLNKATYNWPQLFTEIKSVLQKELPKIKLDKHKQMLSNLSTMSFFEVIHIWKELACYNRKIAKELSSCKFNGTSPSIDTDGFTNSEDVPTFNIHPKHEDIAWSFERTTKWCQQNQKFKQNIKNKQYMTIWDICLATGLNCKDGVHEINEKLCEEDFLTGKCSCQTLDQISVKREQLKAKIQDAYAKIKEITEESRKNEDFIDDFIQIMNRKNKQQKIKIDPKVELNSQIFKYKKELDEILNNRYIHYSDFGMVPFETQYKTWLEIKQAKEKLAAEAALKAAAKEVQVDVLIETPKVTKPVVKVTKLGCKKNS